MTDILAEIVAHKREEVAAAKVAHPLSEILPQIPAAPPVRDFLQALRAEGPTRVIAELKRASPSAGTIRAEGFDPVRIARRYEECGAACLSVLTDRKYFQGDLEFLQAVRQAVSIPVLRKDFLIDPYQVYEARAAGADAVLLIAECLDDARLAELFALTGQLGMTALVEIYEPENLSRVIKLGAPLMGVNNRNLKTMEIRLEHTLDLQPQVPAQTLLVSESGIKTRADVQRLEQSGIRAILVGESLMRASDPGAQLRTLIGLPPA